GVTAYIASQSNGSKIKYEDINQIDKDNIEEMDIKWNMALLIMRADRFWKKTGKMITIQENHALVVDDEAPTEFALMAKSSSSFENEVEARLVELKTQEIKFCKKIRGLEFNVKNKNIKIKNLMNELEKIKKEKEGLDSKLTGFESASKDLDTLLGSQGSDKNKEGLPEFADDTITDYSRPSPSIEIDSPTVIKTNKVETVRKPSVKYAEMYRNTTKSPKHMTGNISYLSDYEPYDGGYVLFRHGGGKITGKGSDFKLEDDTNVLLRTFRQHNMYSIDLNNIVPHKNLTCLVAKASANESMLWHRRLVVTDDFYRFTWTFFLKTKDETSGILRNFIIEIENLKDLKFILSLELLILSSSYLLGSHMIFVVMEMMTLTRTLIEAARTILTDAKLPVTFWAEVVNTACYVQNRVLVNKSQNKTPYELFNSRTPAIGFLRPFGCHVMILNTLYHLGKFDAKGDEGTKDVASQDVKKDVSSLRYIDLPNWFHEAHLESSTSNAQDACNADAPESSGNSNPTATSKNPLADQMETLTVESAIPTVSSPVPIACLNDSPEPLSTTRIISKRVTSQDKTPSLDNISTLSNRFEDIFGVTTNTGDTNRVEADLGNMEYNLSASPTPTFRIHKDHPKSQIISPVDTPEEPKKIFDALKDPSWVEAMQEELLQFKIQNVWILVDGPEGEEEIGYEEVFAPVVRIEAIRLFLAYAYFMAFTVYRMDVKSAFLYGTINEEVYVMQPPGFQDLEIPNRVYKVEKAMYGLHQAPRAWYGTLSEYLLANGFQKGTIDQTLEFEALMHDKFQMSAMGELNFLLGLHVLQKKDGIFLSQDKYVGDILKKFGYSDVKSANTPMDKENPWGKDGPSKDVELHLYRSMIRSLMYLTASRLDIMFAICARARHQLTPKECHLYAVRRIFRYLKGHPKLGLWYPKESLFDLVAYSDSDYGGATQDRKSTTRGYQFLGRRLISWQCKKQIIMATSTTKAEYVAAASGCGQVCGFKISCWIMDDNVADLLTKPFDAGRFQYLVEKLEHNVDFHQIVDFVEASHIRYALTINPTIYVSHIRQFWSTARIETKNTVDGKPRTISESSIRRNLKLNDKEEISTLPDAKLFENLELMGYNILPNQKFTFQKATNKVYNFLKMIFDGMVRNVNNKGSNFSMYPRQYSRRATRIAQSKALLTAVDEPASLLRDDNQGEAFLTVFGLEAGQERENIIKTSALPHDSTPRVTSLDADKGKLSGDDALIKGWSLETGEEAGVQAVSVPPAAEVSTVDVPNGSGLVPTVSAIFTTASMVTPYSRRKVAREIEEEMAREDQRLNEHIARDAEIARIHAKEVLQMLIDGLDRNNEVIAKHLQEYEQSAAELTIGEKIDLINELVKYQDHNAKILKYQAQQSKPLFKKEQREFYMSTLKSQSGWKTKHFREEGERLKRKWLKLEQGSTKKVKTSKDVSEEDLKEMMQLVPVEEQEEKQIEEEQAANARYWKILACCDDDDDYNSAITPNEPVDSLIMGDELLDTILATKSDKFIKSSVENLVPNPSESGGENNCDMPVCFTTFSNVLFDAEYEFDSTNDQSLSDEDFLEEIYSNPLFEEEIISMKIDPHHFDAESDLIASMLNHDSSIIPSSSKIDSLLDEFTGELILLKSISLGIDKTYCYPEEEIRLIERLLYDNLSPRPPKEFVFENSNAEIESFSPSPIPVEDSDSFMEENDLTFTLDDLMPSGIEDDDYESKRDILIREEFLDNYSLSFPENESFYFDIPSFSRPPAKPPYGNT
nr:hypothetical protein [Tanacetum cinerariifolium]